MTEDRRATRSDWKHFPLPEDRLRLEIDRRYSADEFARVQEGLVPEVMEDKWFVFYEAPRVFFHRSWTGFCIFEAAFEVTREGAARVTEVLVNGDPKQYSGFGDAQSLVEMMLDSRAGRDTRRVLLDHLKTMSPADESRDG